MKKLMFILLTIGCIISKSCNAERNDVVYSLLFAQTNVIICTSNTVQLVYNIKKGKAIPIVGFFTGTVQTIAGVIYVFGDEDRKLGVIDLEVGLSALISSTINLYNMCRKEESKTNWNLKTFKMGYNNDIGVALKFTRKF